MIGTARFDRRRAIAIVSIPAVLTLPYWFGLITDHSILYGRWAAYLGLFGLPYAAWLVIWAWFEGRPTS
jgi:hypothetical protein